MNILCPVNSIEEVDPVLQAGANEIYCGLISNIPGNENERISYNARQFDEANLKGFDDLSRIAARSRELSVPVYITFNLTYSLDQIPVVLNEISHAIKVGVSGFIVSDISLIRKLRKRYPNITLILSTIGGAFNQYAVRLFQDLGIDRVILPRHLELDEIRAIASACPTMNFEAFVMSERCNFPNALCKFSHADPRLRHKHLYSLIQMAKAVTNHTTPLLDLNLLFQPLRRLRNLAISKTGPVCGRAYQGKLFDINSDQLQSEGEFRFLDDWNCHQEACGLCAIYDLAEIPNLSSVKIVGRHHGIKRKIADTKLVYNAIQLARQNPNRELFIESVKKQRLAFFPEDCRPNRCYYPNRSSR